MPNIPLTETAKSAMLKFRRSTLSAQRFFYNAVLGWQIRKRGDGQLAFDDAVNEVSGTWVTGRKATPEPGLLVYIMVDSVAATIDAVVANGGKIVQPIGVDAPEITARFSDPAGNVFGLYQQPA
ncbi:MAG: hypothetical protein ALAOOOJD_03326 [bacterium]|nr:hypothetical protein [bacterium]